jgi:hypothetical protein
MDKIKSFSEFVEAREVGEEDDQPLGDIDAMPNEDEMLMKLAQMAISRHQERLMDFFNTLARHDDDIKRILGKYRDKQRDFMPNDLRKGNNPEEKDIVAPSTADMSGPL